MVNRISAQIIADSVNSQGDRLTTFILVFPRIVLAEFNTHRMISKNSASSRAIPFKVMVDKVKNEPFVPIGFQKEHKGMQGTDYFTDTEEFDVAKYLFGSETPDMKGKLSFLQEQWQLIAKKVAGHAQQLSDFGLTKQLCNRLLEPFLYHTVICTGTEWENFFALRAHPAAEIHIADLAEKMLTEYNKHTPKLLQPGQWHIPFGDTFDLTRLNQLVGEEIIEREEAKHYDKHLELLEVKIATARCARVSYLNFEGKDDYRADIKLYDTLLGQGHMSPFEHCARTMTPEEYDSHASGSGYNPFDQEESHIFFEKAQFGWSGNFKGFIQHRKMLRGENKNDVRVKK